MESKYVIDKNYIVIQGWMVSKLELKGNELLIYAIIYGFSQIEGQNFAGSLQYLAHWTNSTKQGVLKTLKSLVEKGYISKFDKYTNNIKSCEYHIVSPKEVVNSVPQGSELSSMEVVNSVPQGSELSSPNNINNNINNNLEDNKREIIKEKADGTVSSTHAPKKKKYGEFNNVLLSDEEYNKLQKRFPIEYTELIERLSSYIASKRVKYDSHYATILNWVRKDEKENKKSASPPDDGWAYIKAVARGEIT